MHINLPLMLQSTSQPQSPASHISILSTGLMMQLLLPPSFWQLCLNPLWMILELTLTCNIFQKKALNFYLMKTIGKISPEFINNVILVQLYFSTNWTNPFPPLSQKIIHHTLMFYIRECREPCRLVCYLFIYKHGSSLKLNRQHENSQAQLHDDHLMQQSSMFLKKAAALQQDLWNEGSLQTTKDWRQKANKENFILALSLWWSQVRSAF